MKIDEKIIPNEWRECILINRNIITNNNNKNTPTPLIH